MTDCVTFLVKFDRKAMQSCSPLFGTTLFKKRWTTSLLIYFLNFFDYRWIMLLFLFVFFNFQKVTQSIAFLEIYILKIVEKWRTKGPYPSFLKFFFLKNPETRRTKGPCLSLFWVYLKELCKKVMEKTTLSVDFFLHFL